MAKVTINGEVFDWDPVRKPMAEALAIEEATKAPYVEFEEGLAKGSVKALAAFVWLVWRRNGRDVPLADILSGAVDVDLATLNMEPDEGETGPTVPTRTASGTTGAGISGSSRKSSGSARGRSGS